MLGPLEVRDGAGSPREVSGTRLRALLELLALRAGDVVPPSSLIDELWGERLPADALNALQALVSRLRRAIGEPSAVVSGPAGYQLKVDRDDIDVFRFERLTARGRAALAGRPDEAAGLLGQVLALTTVVLPAPFGPSRPKTLPPGMVRSTPSTAVVAPKRLVRPRATTAPAVPVVGVLAAGVPAVVLAVMPATVEATADTVLPAG
jgi:hypothetical protein